MTTETQKFKQKFRVDSSRLQNYDYSQNGMYFVTICTKNKEHFFGEIENGKMVLSEIGKMADKFWQEIPAHFPFICLDAHQVMPDHLHGILEINWDNTGELLSGVEISGVETQNFASLRQAEIYKNKFGPQSKNLSSVIRGFKVGVKKYTTKNEIYFAWQPRFYDRVIRNYDELNRVREYILANPAQWENDQNQSENLWM